MLGNGVEIEEGIGEGLGGDVVDGDGGWLITVDEGGGVEVSSLLVIFNMSFQAAELCMATVIR